MTKYSTNNFSVINLHKKASAKSEVVTQMIYGESFSISKKDLTDSNILTALTAEMFLKLS